METSKDNHNCHSYIW